MAQTLNVNIPTELYADDALLHHTFKRSTTALSVRGALQTAVLAAEQWALQWHGRFGHAKTKQLNIGQRQNLPLATVIEDHQIEEVVHHKHLGITFTSDLKWNVHIQEVIGNAAKRAGLLRWMSHHLRGPLIAHLYLAYVRPTMEYASPLWHGPIRDEDAFFFFFFFFAQPKRRLITKTIGNRKRDCAWGGSGWQTLPEKIYRSQSKNQSAKLNERLPDLCFAICRFSQVRFVTQSHLTHNLFFYFQ